MYMSQGADASGGTYINNGKCLRYSYIDSGGRYRGLHEVAMSECSGGSGSSGGSGTNWDSILSFADKLSGLFGKKETPTYVAQPSGPSTTTLLLIAGVVIGGVYLLKRKK